MNTPQRKAPAPRNLAMKLPPDAAEILHRTAYETGKTKLDLVSEAIRLAYGQTPEQGEDP